MLDPGKPLKIGVGRVDRAPMFDSERGDVGIGREVAGRTTGLEEAPQDGPVAFAGGDGAGERLVEPGVDVVERTVGAQGPFEETPAGRDPEEGEENDPGEAHLLCGGKGLLQPPTRLSVMYESAATA